MPLKILVVDHDATTVGLVQDVFCSHGAQVRAVKDGVQAVAPIVEEKFDGFLLEVNTPNTDGCRLSHWIRQSARNGRAPVIHMSTRSDPHIMHRAFQAGGTFFLVKPLDRGRLMRLFRCTSGIMLQERRRYWRIPLALPSHCAIGSNNFSGCLIRNLSVTGVLLGGNPSLHPGVHVYLAFSLAPSDPQPVSARGVVVRIDDSGQAGIRFTQLRQADYNRILDRIAMECDAA